MAKSDLSTIIVYGGGMLIAYYTLKSWGVIITPCPSEVCTPECPRGPKYSRSYFIESCLPNYVDCGTWTPECCCLSEPQTASLNKWKPLTEQELLVIRKRINEQ